MWEQLVDAIERKKVETARQILRQKPELVVGKNYQDETLLHFAAKSGSLEIVAELLVKGAKPDIPDEFGWTPLHEACSQGHDEVVALFLKLPFNVDGTSKQRETALQVAARHGHARIVARLLKANAATEFRNQQGNTPLQVAALAGRIDIMQLLADKGADIAARNLAGETALHCAAREGRIEAAEWCLAHGADPNDQDKADRTFIDSALREGRMQFIQHFSKLDTPLPTPDQPDPMTITGIKRFVATEARDLATKALSHDGKLLGAFLYGADRQVGRRKVWPVFEAGLWFFGFPFLVYVVFAGLFQRAIPIPVGLPWTALPGPWHHFFEVLLNTLLIMVGSHLMVSSVKETPSYHFIILNLRPTLLIRLCHFLLIDALFFRGLTFDFAFWKGFFLWWLCFLMIYSLAFFFWWFLRHTPKAEAGT